jgi:hypothetical protein
LRWGGEPGCPVGYSFLTMPKLCRVASGAKRGANEGRKWATVGHGQRRLQQLNGAYSHNWRYAETDKMRLKSGKSAVRPRP